MTLLFALALAVATASVTNSSNADATAQLALYDQRATYRSALEHLAAGRTSAFKRAKRHLQDYTLLPYLEYHQLQSQLSVASAEDIETFRSTHSDLPVANIVYRRWLKRLGQRREWAQFLRYYEPTTSTELQCYQLRALYGTGKKTQAFSQVEALWVVGKSQPKSCDPLFDVWILNKQLTYRMAWQRLQLALENNQRQLARYLLRFFDGAHKRWARSLYNVHVDPTAITRTSRYAADTPNSRKVIHYGLLRLATRSVDKANASWTSYRQSHNFTAEQRANLDTAMLTARAKEGLFSTRRPKVTDKAVIEAMAAAAVKYRNWPEAQHWIEQLPPVLQSSHRWQYWLARAISASFLHSKRAEITYRALADQRDYYGFLAAERLGVEPRLNPAAHTVSPAELELLRKIPAVLRTTELYAVGDLINARREWNYLVPQLTPQQQADAAYLTQNIGWTSQAIHIANAAKLRNHLDLRFPVVYQSDFQRLSHITTVPQTFLISVARQESAFDPAARSSADARGLMQLLHSTATGVAKHAQLPTPTVLDLYVPQANIEIAAHHLADLLLRYDNVRPLAAAAYNAGQHRVDRWIRNARGMPMDIWIETIPFRETRNYVKNVLAFTQVYGQRLNQPAPMLHAHEVAVP